ncbi:hypothetical protein M3I56_31495 [Paraburkholderia sp. CNPSo 3281]|nr:hypothetical protein [Paraburkholderia sp. CNPSo 3281]
MRTSLLVCLAACLAMLQVNVLFVLHGVEHIEHRLPRGKRAYITLGHDAGDDARKLFDDALRGRRCRVVLLGVTHLTAETASHQRLDASFEVRWQAPPATTPWKPCFPRSWRECTKKRRGRSSDEHSDVLAPAHLARRWPFAEPLSSIAVFTTAR